MKRIFLLGLMLMARISWSAETCEAEVYASKTTLGYDGCISQRGYERLKKSSLQHVDTLLIRSEGGDVSAGLLLAHLITQRKWIVRIRGHCHSSCANYILPAGRRKIIERDATIVYHGDARTTEVLLPNLHTYPKNAAKALHELSIHEAQLASQNIDIAATHQIQLIAKLPIETIIPGGLPRHPNWSCTGAGLREWLVAQENLGSYLTEVIPNQAPSEFLSEMPPRLNSTEQSPPVEFNPLNNCRIHEQ